MIKIATMNVRGLRKAHLKKKTDNDNTSQNGFFSWLRKTENDIFALTELGFKDTPSDDEQKKYKQILKYNDAAWTSDCALLLRDPALSFSHMQTFLHGRVIFARVTSSSSPWEPLFVLFMSLQNE